MAKLKVPSLQHLARNCHSDPQLVKRALVRLAKNKPIFNYNPLVDAVRDMLIFDQPYDEIVCGIERHAAREFVRKCFLDVLPLIRDYFDGVDASFVHDVQPRYYPIAKGLLVPFQPPLIYGAGGRLCFPWFSFWRTNPVIDKRLSLFVSVVEEILLSDPDLEDAKFEILDFSAPERNSPRTLNVIDTDNVVRISEEAKTEMLAIFAEGFSLAEAELAGTEKNQRPESRVEDIRQPGLFDT